MVYKHQVIDVNFLHSRNNIVNVVRSPENFLEKQAQEAGTYSQMFSVQITENPKTICVNN